MFTYVRNFKFLPSKMKQKDRLDEKFVPDPLIPDTLTHSESLGPPYTLSTII